MPENTLVVLFWTWPVLLGLFFWLSRATYAVTFGDRAASWLGSARDSLKHSPSRIARYWARPTLVVAYAPLGATAGIRDPFLRTGVRAAIAPYVTGFILAATLLALELAIAGSLIFLLFLIWGFMSILMDKVNGKSDNAEATASPFGRIRSSRLVKTGFLGDSPTGIRVDQTGRVMREHFLGDRPTGVRFDEDGRIMKESFFGDLPSGLRVDSEGRLVQEGLLGDHATGKKIDKDGRVLEEGFLGDTPVGVAFKKE